MQAAAIGISLFLSTSVAAGQALSPGTWAPQSGDWLYVDVSHNAGYLIHPNKSYLPFPVVTGQRRVVRYLGLTYNASTPTQTWTAETEESKGDHITFGPTGKFFRLFDKGGDSTSYGIHGHAYADEMLSRDDRYRSMGCIIVSERMLAVLERTFSLNRASLAVLTGDGPPKGVETPVQ